LANKDDNNDSKACDSALFSLKNVNVLSV